MTQKKFAGKWEIMETEMWAKEDLDLTETAYIQFDGSSGQFHFICVDGYMDVEYTSERVDFSWLGNDETDMSSGRGWASIKGNELQGKIYFHQGDSSSFVAVKKKQG